MAPEPLAVLLTGGSGFLGRRVAHRLAEDPAFALCATSRSGDAIHGSELVPTDLEGLARHIEGRSFDTVVHLAALVADGRTETTAAAMMEANVVGTQHVLEACETAPRRVVLASTLDVYRAPGPGEVVDEDHELGPSTSYGLSKLLAEQVVEFEARSRGFEPFVARLGHLYGPGEQAYGKLVPAVIGGIARGRPPVIFGSGTAQRDLLHVDDAAEAIVRAIRAGVPPGPVNVVSGTSRSVEAIVEAICEVADYVGPVKRRPDHSDGASWAFDASKMHDVLGRWPQVPFEEGLREELFEASRWRALLAHDDPRRTLGEK